MIPPFQLFIPDVSIFTPPNVVHIFQNISLRYFNENDDDTVEKKTSAIFTIGKFHFPTNFPTNFHQNKLSQIVVMILLLCLAASVYLDEFIDLNSKAKQVIGNKI